MKTTHTHRGHCQACGALQAVDNTSKLIAKHGYKVSRFGCFVGTCPGSDRKPAEFDVSYTHRVMVICTDHAAECDRLAALYSSRDLMLTCYTTSNYSREARAYISRTLPLIGCTDERIMDEYTCKVSSLRNEAEGNRSHCKFLKRDILPLLGRDLVPVEALVKVKPVEGRVDVKAGTIEGAFHTKAAQKLALEAISRDYSKQREMVMNAVLNIAYDDRTPAQLKLYNEMPHDLHNFRVLNHGNQIVDTFPHLAAVNFEICRLFDLRVKVKAQPVIKGGAK